MIKYILLILLTFIGLIFFSFTNQNIQNKLKYDEEKELSLDSIVLIKGNEWYDYLKNPKHPLKHFGVPYEDWNITICMIALNEGLYWDKRNIGTVEKSGNLKLSINNQEIYLLPKTKIKFKEGIWRNTYQNDSISVRIAIKLEKGKIENSVTGKGRIELKIKGKVYNETAYFVADI